MPFTNHHNHWIKCKTVNWNSCMASPITKAVECVCELNWKCQQNKCVCVCVAVVAFIEINWLKIESILRIEKRHDMCYSWANTYNACCFYFLLPFFSPFGSLFFHPHLFFKFIAMFPFQWCGVNVGLHVFPCLCLNALLRVLVCCHPFKIYIIIETTSKVLTCNFMRWFYLL